MNAVEVGDEDGAYYEAKEQSSLESEDFNSCSKDPIQECLENRKTVRDAAVQHLTENACFTDLSAVTSESATSAFELESNISLVQKNYREIKDDFTSLKKDIKSAKKVYRDELSQLMKSIEMIKSEKTSSERQLKECSTREEKLKDSLQKSEAEKQIVSRQLSNKEAVVREFTAVLQRQKQIVSSLHNKCNRKGKGSSELKKGIQTIESQIVHFEQHLKGKLKEDETLKKSLEAMEAERKDQSTGEKDESAQLMKNTKVIKPNKTLEKRLEEECVRRERALKDSLQKSELGRLALVLKLSEKDKEIRQLYAICEEVNTLKKETGKISRDTKKLGKLKDVRYETMKVEKQALEESLKRMESEKQTLMDRLTEEKNIKLNGNSSKFKNGPNEGENSQFNKSAEILKLQTTCLEKQLEECSRKEGALKECLQKSEAEREALLNEVCEKEDAVDDLTMELKERREKWRKMKRKLNKKEKEVFKLLTEKKNSTESLQRVEAERRKLMSELAEEKEKNSRLDLDLSKQNEVTSKLGNELNKIKEELSKEKEKFQTLQLEKEKEGTAFQTAEAEKPNLMDQLVKEKRKNSEMSVELTKQREIADRFRKELDSKVVQILEMKKKADTEIKEDLREVTATIEALQETVRRLESEKQAVLAHLDEEKKETASLKENILLLNKELNRKKVEVIETSEDIAILECEKVILENNLRERDMGAEHLKNSVHLLVADKQNLCDALFAEKEKSDSLQAEVERLKLQMGRKS